MSHLPVTSGGSVSSVAVLITSHGPPGDHAAPDDPTLCSTFAPGAPGAFVAAVSGGHFLHGFLSGCCWYRWKLLICMFYIQPRTFAEVSRQITFSSVSKVSKVSYRIVYK